MAVQIEIEVEGSATSDGKYRVTWEVVDNEEMPSEIFKHTTATDRFDGVISVADLTYPTSRSSEDGYYRKSSATQVYDTIEDAESAKDNVAGAVQDLVDMYKDGLADFLTTENNSYS